MGLLTSVLNLAFVAAAGWFTIYYLVPKLTGETTNNTAAADTAGSSGSEEDDIQKALEDTLAGLTEGDETTTPEPKPETNTKKKKKSGTGGKTLTALSSPEQIEGYKKRRKDKSTKSKTEYRYFYLGEYY